MWAGKNPGIILRSDIPFVLFSDAAPVFTDLDSDGGEINLTNTNLNEY